ncbi:hypothetical protein BD324DRAFT_604289 [Kockovaella imperatae]|uniref:Uncharacterized protein n=1 Tax=Kockovaella imperatae TaxID=4999 RepID=A0A1Y1U9S9_9TREE|nr:hypothetical protein BD324DRAFT_604289 [Kockovaella imperatae]ORX34772.1 hypothetical protein BD324DRAFT_604289 [Kockovaella imperatae]
MQTTHEPSVDSRPLSIAMHYWLAETLNPGWSRRASWLLFQSHTPWCSRQLPVHLKRQFHRTIRARAQSASFSEGPSEPSLLRDTIPQHFARIVASHPTALALVARSSVRIADRGSVNPKEISLTYAQLDRLSDRLASGLQVLGVQKGDRVAVSLGNVAEYGALTYAVFKLGAILVPLNPSFNAFQVERALNHLSVKVLIIGALTDLAYRPGQGSSNLDILKHVEANGLARSPEITSSVVPSLRRIVILDNRSEHPDALLDLDSYTSLTPYEHLLSVSESRPARNADQHPDDIINIQFTSGTTSMPKAAQLSHRNILNNGFLTARRMGLVPGDRIVVPPPLFHCFGSVLGYMATATTGSTLMFASPAFDPHATLRMCREHDATGLYGVPTMLLAVLDALEAEGVQAPPNLAKGILAGSSVPQSLMHRIHQKLGMREAVICYGMTETSPISCMTSPTDPVEKQTRTIGKVMPHTKVKIVSPVDRNKILPRGEKGEFAASGYLVMAGYYNDPERTAESRIADADGTVWMYSGDEAEMDADGYVSITGRIKDLIIRGGENIHPLDIEDCLFQLDGVREVSVVGVPDEKLGEVVAAFIVPKDGVVTGPDDTIGESHTQSSTAKPTLTKEIVRDWVKRQLSSHLTPKFVFWTEQYPKTASGKIQKFMLRDMALKKLGREKSV